MNLKLSDGVVLIEGAYTEALNRILSEMRLHEKACFATDDKSTMRCAEMLLRQNAMVVLHTVNPPFVKQDWMDQLGVHAALAAP